ncbi:uncharacterized protein CCR75_003259 [Bremia lactucae]|uniref:Uncharacterized protein n=1 Tax=Bremia lactucae TaxID=4779 RepID=A0A976NYJ4_BRELC|nr:hypothetical protein CCR75_003259 [Bremia lactucae]
MQRIACVTSAVALFALQVQCDADASYRRLEALNKSEIKSLDDFFDTKMETRLTNLPKSGQAPEPWSGPLWLSINDSINYAWNDGQPSPSAKYALAFNMDVKEIMDKVSAKSGVDAYETSKICTSSSQCDNAFCAIRTNAVSGRCLQPWFGLSHGLVPASLLEKKPVCSVKHNNVVFEPIDIMGLITFIYAEANLPRLFIGKRYRGDDGSEDAHGRFSVSSYRDVNPGIFHITASNLLGKLNRSFIIDIHADELVWNQPVHTFKVTKQKLMTLKEAAQEFYKQDSYTWNADATEIAHVNSQITTVDAVEIVDGKLSVSLPAEPLPYDYILELNKDGKIVGGEWVRDSLNQHPDFYWIPQSRPAADFVSVTGLSYADVSLLAEKSAACSDKP